MFINYLHAIIYIFRHGDTYQTKNKLPYKDKAISAPIIPEAKVYLEKIGNFLKHKNVEDAVTSAFPRCLQSAEIVGKQSEREFRIDKRLNEYDPIYLPGESEEHFKKRIESFLSDVIKNNYSSIAICTHGAVISFIKHKLVNSQIKWDNLDYPAPGVLLTIHNGKVSANDFRTAK